jgi:hypothetical protein
MPNHKNVLFLGLYLYIVDISLGLCQHKVHDIMDISPKSSTPLITMIEKYIHHHSLRSLNEQSVDDICTTGLFVTNWGGFGCGAAGNLFGALLSDAVMALVLNRTLIVSEKYNYGGCHGGLKLRDWVPTQNYMMKRLETSTTECKAKYDFNKRFTIETVDVCNMAELASEPITSMDLIFNTAFDVFSPLNTYLDEDSRYRAALLFNDNFYQEYGQVNSSEVVAGIPGNAARFSSYGILSKYLLEFTPAVSNLTAGLLSTLYDNDTCDRKEDEVAIGVHVRHIFLSDKIYTKYDALTKDAISQILASDALTHGSRKCVLLIASDRENTMETLRGFAKDLNCRVLKVEKDIELQKKMNPDGGSEHGP